MLSCTLMSRATDLRGKTAEDFSKLEGLPVASDMVQFTTKGPQLSARLAPWGEPTRTFLPSKDRVKGDWTVETTLRFASDLLAQGAGIYVGSPEKFVRLNVQRPGNPFGLILQEGTQTQTSFIQGSGENKPLSLRMVRKGDWIYGFYRTGDGAWLPAGAIRSQLSEQDLPFGLCLIDDNPHQFQKGVAAGAARPAQAVFETLSAKVGLPETFASDVPKLYSRVHIQALSSSIEVKGLWAVYAPLDNTIFKTGLLSAGEKLATSVSDPNLGISWDKVEPTLKVGDVSGWVDLTPLVGAPRSGATAMVSFFDSSRPMKPNSRRDDGNIDGFSAQVDFATEPEEGKIIHSVSLKDATGSSLAMVFPPSYSSLVEWVPRIRSQREYNAARLAAAKKAGARNPDESPLASIVVNIPGGIHYCERDKQTVSSEYAIATLLGGNRRRHWLPEHPTSSGAIDPWLPDVEKEYARILQTRLATESGPETNLARQTVMLGDEPHLIPLKKLRDSLDGLKAFRDSLRSRGITPASLGLNSLDEALPVEKSDARTVQERLLAVETARFIQDASQMAGARMRIAAEGLFGDGVEVSTDNYFAGWDITGDYFVESRKGASRRFLHHFAGEHNAAFDIFNVDMLRSASAYGQTRGGFLFFLNRITAGDGGLLSGHAALSRGLAAIRFYGLGPLPTGWEWFSDDFYKVDAFAAGSTTSRVAGRYAQYLNEGFSPTPKVATFLSRSAALWAGSGDPLFSLDAFGHTEAKEENKERLNTGIKGNAAIGWAVERDMVHVGLGRSGYTVGVIPEEEVEWGRLLTDDLKVLYVVDPNVSLRAQEQIEAWVKLGGVLYLGPEAGSRDEVNEPSSLLKRLTGLTAETVAAETKSAFANPGSFGEVWQAGNAYSERHVNALRPLDRITFGGKTFDAVGRKERLLIDKELHPEVPAAMDDGTPALVIIPAGSGFVVKAATNLGAALARSAQPGFDAQRDLNWPPLPYTPERIQYWRRSLGQPELELLMEPLRAAKVKPEIQLSSQGVDAKLFELAEERGGMVVIGDYRTEDSQPVTVNFQVEGSYTKAETFSGNPVNFVQDGKQVRLSLKPALFDVVELKP
jgi:hypothetical protein